MAIRTKAALKAFFNTGDKPTEEEFSDLIDSLRHIQTAIEMEEVSGLVNTLNTFITIQQAQEMGLDQVLSDFFFSSYILNFIREGIIREAVFFCPESVKITIRKNSNSDTDFILDIPANTKVLHNVNMPVFAGAVLEFLYSGEETIEVDLYIANKTI